MNIIVSGWPASGQTTLAIILARALNFTLIRGSSTFRYIWAKLNHENTGEDRVKGEELQTSWGILYEKYVAKKIYLNKNLVLESDITGFMIHDPQNVFSVFVKTDVQTRSKRLLSDNRAEDIAVLANRDAELKQKYKDLFNVDFFNLEVINKDYSLVLDNSNIDIPGEVILVLQKYFPTKNAEVLKKAVEVSSQYIALGKEVILQSLESENLLMAPEDIFREVKENFPEELENLPKDIKGAIGY